MSISIYLTDRVPKVYDATFTNAYSDLSYTNQEQIIIIAICNPLLISILQKLYPHHININLYFPFVLQYSFLKEIFDLGTTTIYCSPDYYQIEIQAFSCLYIKLQSRTNNDFCKYARAVRLRIVQHPDYPLLQQYLVSNFEDFPLKCLIPPIPYITRHSTDEDLVINCHCYINLLKHGICAAKPYIPSNELVMGLSPKIKVIKQLILEYPDAICIVKDHDFMDELTTFTKCLAYSEYLNQRINGKIFKTLILVDIPFCPIFRIYGANKCFVIMTEPEQTELNLALKELNSMTKFNGKIKTIFDSKTRTLGNYTEPLLVKGESLPITPLKDEELIKKSRKEETPVNLKIKLQTDTPQGQMTPIQHNKNKLRVIHSETPIPNKENTKPISSIIDDFLDLEASCSDKRTDTSFSVISNTQDRNFIGNNTVFSSDIAIYKELHSTPQYKGVAFKPILVTQSDPQSEDEVGSLHEFVQDEIQYSSDYLNK